MNGPDRLRCRVEDHPPHIILELEGELDLRTAPVLRAAAHKALATHPTCLIVDSSRLRLTEDVAATVLPTLALNAAVWPGSAVVLCATSPALLARLARLGARRRLIVCHSLDQAKTVADTQPALPTFSEYLPEEPALTAPCPLPGRPGVPVLGAGPRG